MALKFHRNWSIRKAQSAGIADAGFSSSPQSPSFLIRESNVVCFTPTSSTSRRRLPLFPTRYGNGSGPEQGVLHGSLRGDGTELELALIELIDDLAHGCLIQIGGSSQWPLRLCGRRDRRNCGRRRDERRLSRPRRAGSRQDARQDYKPHSRIQPSAERSAYVAVDSRVGD